MAQRRFRHLTVGVLDTSALLPVALREPGGNAIADKIEQHAFCSFNLAEFWAVLLRQGASEAGIQAVLADLAPRVVILDEDLAVRAARLHARTRMIGLSMGDCVCLALAQRESLPAVTADRVWRQLPADLGIVVSLLR